MYYSNHSKLFTKPLCLLVGFFILFSCEENASELNKFEGIPIMQQEELRATFADTFQESVLNGSDYIVGNDQKLTIDLSKMKSMGAFLPKNSQIQLSPIDGDGSFGRIESGEDVEARISDTQFSEEFKGFSFRLLQFSEKLEFMTYQESTNKLAELENDVQNSGLDEFERIAMFEVLNVSKIILEESFSIYQQASENGRIECETNWRDIAKDALKAGIVSGAGVGLSWAKAGAIATTAGGQPWVGAIVGGLAGFTTGFIYGGLIAGTANYISQQAFPDCDNTGKSKLAVDFVCLDPLCNERVPLGSVGIKASSDGTIYFVGG